MNTLRMILLALICMGASNKLHALNVPRLVGRVNDTAGILTRDEVAGIENSLKDYEGKTSNQIAVLTTRDLQGETIESYANQIFRSWKLGQKDKNNGILIVISVGAKNTARIEVGYGLEGVVPDAIARAIINDDMRPLFKEKKYQACLMAAVGALERSIGGEYKAKVVASSGSANSSSASANWKGRCAT